MKHYTTLFTKEALETAIANKLVSVRKHPELPLYIYNYTASALFDWKWDAVTLNCRGLVLDAEGNIIARSLPKFFSYEQLEGNLPSGNFVVEEKLDGSMLLVFKYNNQLVTATRGSFESEQAIKAKEYLEGFDTPVGYTWVFEIIYKENKIVVDYDYEGLVLLTVVDSLGRETMNVYDLAKTYEFRIPKIYSFASVEDILNHNEPNIEGFVLRYVDTNERVKIKLEEYKRLHRALTGFNEKDVWEALRSETLDQVLEGVPDEMYDWVREIQRELEDKFQSIRLKAMSEMKDFGNRKDNALYYQTCAYPAIMFYLLDGKDIKDLIWKMVKPKVTRTFKLISEDSN